jgi:hypothetical protein
MTKKIVLALLALALLVLPATAQNQWLTSFNDNVGDHIYYQVTATQGPGSGPGDIWQLWPTGSWNGDMNSLTPNFSQGCWLALSCGPFQGSPLVSFTNSTGQHVFYIDRIGLVRDLAVSSSGVVTDPAIQPSTGTTLAGFSDARGEHIYYILSGNVWHSFGNGGAFSTQNLTLLAHPLPACAVVSSGLTAFADTVSQPSQPAIELVYYVGPTNHLCELAWYQGKEQSYDLTYLCEYSSSCAVTLPHPMLNSPLTGFADARGQHVFYLDAQTKGYPAIMHDLDEFSVTPSALANVDLTKWSGGTPAFPDSLTSVSNQWGPQVFYHCPSAVCEINATTGLYTNLSLAAGGAIPLTYFPPQLPYGTSLSSIGHDDKGGEDVFYIDGSLYVWELHSDNGSTWASYFLFNYCGSPCPPAGQ